MPTLACLGAMTLTVLWTADGLKMSRVDAGAHTAEMVDVVSVLDQAVVHEPMHVDDASGIVDDPVAAA